jgi:hypothetical protein
MKTTLRCLALAGVLAAGGTLLLRHSLPPPLVFHSPGQEWAKPETGSATVRGQVLHDGAGVPGARVLLIPSRHKKQGVIATSHAVVQARTDESGRFELTGAPDGPARIAVLAEGLAPSFTTLDVHEKADLTITVDAGVAMEGIVAAGTDTVAGARVSVRMVGHDADVDHRPLREGMTDAAGRFRFAGLDPSKPLHLVVLADGHRPFEKKIASPLEAPPTIELDPGVQISGRLLTASGEPIIGAEVTAGQGEGYTAQARSGTAGDVQIGGLIPRALTIRVLVEGYAPARLDLPGPQSGWTIHLKRNGGVAGRAPAGSWLVIETPGATFRRDVGADGSFHWDGLPPGPAEARATDREGRILSSSKVEIPEGAVAGGILLIP